MWSVPRRSLCFIALGLGVLLGPAPGAGAAVPEARPRAIASLDYCADQYVLALAARDDILALSPAADDRYSYFASRASGIAKMRPTTERLLMAAPDLVVRQWGGGLAAGETLGRFGIPVAQVKFGQTLADARDNLRAVARRMGREEEAARLLADLDRRLARIRATRPETDHPSRALYVTVSGATSGRGTFIHEAMEAAGLENVMAGGARAGWQLIDLERVALNPPDLIIGAFFDLGRQTVDHWSIGRHSFLRDLVAKAEFVPIPGRVVACSTWFVIDAVEMIHDAALRIARRRAGAGDAP